MKEEAKLLSFALLFSSETERVACSRAAGQRCP
jgi:hypothetical protein